MTTRLPLLLLAFALPFAGCSPDEDKSTDGTETGTDDSEGTEGTEGADGDDGTEGGDGTDGGSGIEAAPLVYSGGDCPVIEDGRNVMLSGEVEREFRVVLPPEPAGAPVLFAWHWLGGRSAQIVSVMDLEALAAEENVIVIAPDSHDQPYEWDFLGGAENNPDLRFFDDMLACTDATFGVDLDRVTATGMSAGGLWTTYLTIHRAEYLAASAPFSGGTLDSYETPAWPLPVMVTWGGESDTYASLSFDETSRDFLGNLLDDGHPVVECVHDGGHTLPRQTPAMVRDFLLPHVRGGTPAWGTALPDAAPDFCRIP